MFRIFRGQKDIPAPNGLISSVDVLLRSAREGCLIGATEDELQDRRKKSEAKFAKIKARERVAKAKEMGLVAAK